VLQHSDLEAVLASRDAYKTKKLVFIDPGYLNKALQAGLAHVDFLHIETGPDFQASASSEAICLATLLDTNLARERERLWPGMTLNGWDVGVSFLALQRMIVARQLGERFRKTSNYTTLGLLRPSVPQQMYFDSFSAAELFAGSARSRFKFVGDYDHVLHREPSVLSSILERQSLQLGMAQGRVSLVTHVPTCSYDWAWMAREVTRAHHFTLDLPSGLWDVPLHRGSAPLIPAHEAPAKDAAVARTYRDRAATVMKTVLSSLLPDEPWADSQINSWADRCEWQALNFMALLGGLQGTRPMFLLADQDTGLNGPLFSVAERLGSSILVAPHSGHPSMLVPHGRRVTVIERAGYGTQARTVLGQRVPVRAVRMQAPAFMQERERVREVCLMLNAMQTEGLSHVDAIALASFYQRLETLCRSRGIKLTLRQKPTAPAVLVLAGLLGLSPEEIQANSSMPLSRLAGEADLCIVFGEPTTGVAPFLESGCPVLQVCSQNWPTDYLVCTPLIEQGVIPMLDQSDALERIEQLMNDQSAFRELIIKQRQVLDQRQSGAHDHLFTSTEAVQSC